MRDNTTDHHDRDIILSIPCLHISHPVCKYVNKCQATSPGSIDLIWNPMAIQIINGQVTMSHIAWTPHRPYCALHLQMCLAPSNYSVHTCTPHVRSVQEITHFPIMSHTYCMCSCLHVLICQSPLRSYHRTCLLSTHGIMYPLQPETIGTCTAFRSLNKSTQFFHHAKHTTCVYACIDLICQSILRSYLHTCLLLTHDAIMCSSQ